MSFLQRFIYIYFLCFNLFPSVFGCDSFGDFECNSVEILLILSSFLFPLKSPVASVVFLIAIFESVLSHLM